MNDYRKVLIILNPTAGQKRANAELTEIVRLFTANEYLPTVLTTLRRGDGTLYAKNLAGEFDLVVAIGGDGSFNEVVAGVIGSGAGTPVGYIPAGSTNDFADSLKLRSDISGAAMDIIKGYPIPLDIGEFNGRCFTHVASFGAFTKTSYTTPQDVKNALGRLAYILSGISSLGEIRPIHLKAEVDGRTFEDDYIFGAVTNSTSMGGIVKLDEGLVDMSDGRFEMLLVKNPRDLIEIAEIVRAVTESDFSDEEQFVFLSGSDFLIHNPEMVDWTLDGEYQKGTAEIRIKNLRHALTLMVNN